MAVIKIAWNNDVDSVLERKIKEWNQFINNSTVDVNEIMLLQVVI